MCNTVSPSVVSIIHAPWCTAKQLFGVIVNGSIQGTPSGKPPPRFAPASLAGVIDEISKNGTIWINTLWRWRDHRRLRRRVTPPHRVEYPPMSCAGYWFEATSTSPPVVQRHCTKQTFRHRALSDTRSVAICLQGIDLSRSPASTLHVHGCSYSR